MADYQDREAFIPYRRSDLIELCIQDGQLADADVQKFRDFCEILAAYYHFQLHHTLEILKDNFTFFNPDSDTKTRSQPNSQQLVEMQEKVVSVFKTLLERANYNPLSEEMLQQAFEGGSLLDLKTDVDFNDFDRVVCYYRGDTETVTEVNKFLKKVEKKVQVLERVALLLKFKDINYFKSKKVKLEKLNFTPGKMYLYYYKNIPKYDLEFLFPNIKVSMTWKDRLLLIVPTIGAAASVLVKLLPQLLLIIGVIYFLLFGKEALVQLNISEENIEQYLSDIMGLLVLVLSLVVALGGVGVKQYTNYTLKKVKFQKSVTDTLFFRNLANNASVFGALIDAAEEEECKEIILVYYHLMTSDKPLNPQELDDKIETWMEEKFGTKIDFDINGPLRNLQSIHGKVVKDGMDEADAPELPMLAYDDRGYCKVPSIDEAKTIIDYVWDNAFSYAQ